MKRTVLISRIMAKDTEYRPAQFERYWQQQWKERGSYRVVPDRSKPKYYALDMFPYPSGAGLHVGHPLGYIASDIVARYKRHCGYCVLHPMGYDSFGLPAEQYAIQTGRHPAETTAENIARYRAQLEALGFCYDWDREIRTSDPAYYRWTQWIFLQLFDSWYDLEQDRARPISELETLLSKGGSAAVRASGKALPNLTAKEWQELDSRAKEEILLGLRLAYRSESFVNWCPALGTVLANDEVKDGYSERGGYPVERRKMLQWNLRITAYAERLLNDLDGLDWTEALKETQRNWIGRSTGASLRFKIEQSESEIEVFTTRPDTLFGVSFLVLAPENELVAELTPPEFKTEVEAYVLASARKSERDRMADVRQVSGVFTGAYALHPFTGEKLPIWLADYVLAGYGTGAIMAVPAHDSRDWSFARRFDLPIRPVTEGAQVEDSAFESKEGILTQSDFLNGLSVSAAIEHMSRELEARGLGRRIVQYKLRDAVFGRQRYWGEPIPVYYDADGIPRPVREGHLPLQLPEIDLYQPTEQGDPPLARAQVWRYDPEQGLVGGDLGFPLETTTMPGWAGSSWYWLRYMDPASNDRFASREAEEYWGEVDLYIGGAEHATGHLLYSRFWQKFLFDRGWVGRSEPFKKLVNQGMIAGVSALIHRLESAAGEPVRYVSAGLINGRKTQPIHIDIGLVQQGKVDLEALHSWRSEFERAEFEAEEHGFFASEEVEKMSKRWHNVVNPDDVIETYGADVLRLFEMFLGPIEQHKPWNTQGLSGVQGFLKKLWRLATRPDLPDTSSEEALRSIHRCIKKVTDDIESLSFNTSVSAFMICVNELQEIGGSGRDAFEILAVLLSPFAPHAAEELWSSILGCEASVLDREWPVANPLYLQKSEVVYPVSFNGKTRFQLVLKPGMKPAEVQEIALTDERSARYLEGKTPKKVIVVPDKIVNIVF